MQAKPNAPAMHVLRPWARISGTSNSGFPWKLATIRGGCSSVGSAFKEMTNAPANVTSARIFAGRSRDAELAGLRESSSREGSAPGRPIRASQSIALTSSDVAQNVSWSPIAVTCVQPGDCSGCIRYLTLMKIVAKSGSVTGRRQPAPAAGDGRMSGDRSFSTNWLRKWRRAGGYAWSVTMSAISAASACGCCAASVANASSSDPDGAIVRIAVHIPVDDDAAGAEHDDPRAQPLDVLDDVRAVEDGAAPLGEDANEDGAATGSIRRRGPTQVRRE